MACIDFLGRDARGEYNIALAKLLGLQTAVYVGVILDILFSVRKKVSFDEEGFWTLKRSYVEDMTTLTTEQQKSCEDALISVGVMDVSGNKVRFRADVLLKLIGGEISVPEETLKAIQHKVNSPKLTASEKRMFGLIKCIPETDVELHQAYVDWVSVINDKGGANKVVIENFVRDVNNYTSDKNTKLRLIHIATQTGYKLVEWCIPSLNKTFGNKNLSSAVKLPEQKISNGELDNENIF